MVQLRHGAPSTTGHTMRHGIDQWTPEQLVDAQFGRALGALERARPAWQRTAPCRATPALFTSGKPKDRAMAFTMCAGCEHRDPCLAFAIELDDYTNVIYGGADGAARRQIAKQRAKAWP